MALKNKIMQLIVRIPFFLSALFLLALFFGCIGTKNGKGSDMNARDSITIIGSNEDSNKFSKKTFVFDSHKEREGRNPPQDSLNNWLKQYEKDIVDLAPKISESTKVLLIDTFNNKIINSTILKYKGIYIKEKSNNNENIDRIKYEKLIPIISKNWTLDNDSFSSVEFPNLKSLKNRTSFDDASHNFLVVAETDSHGGGLSKIYFFNNHGILLNSIEFEKTILSPIFGFNNEKTFFYIASLVSPEIFIYKPDGTILLGGNYHSLTGDNGTSYGQPIVSKSGKYIILKNNLAWIFEDKVLISKIKYNGLSVIDEENELIAYEFKNTLYINDIKENSVKYILPNNNIYLVKIQPNSEIIFTKYANIKNRFSYKVFDY